MIPLPHRVSHKILTTGITCPEAPRVISLKSDRPYFETWLRRTSRQFAVSGRLSQTAVILAREEGGTPEEWRTRLLTLLEGKDTPSLDLLTRIDALLAGPRKAAAAGDSQGSLF
jgi:hypothetical protein